MSPLARGEFSILVPAYQCADRLPGHIQFLRKIRPHAAELIWAVTESPDGTHELARRAHAELGGKFLITPRGLYASWNAGIREVTSEFLYISTVGETITAEGIGRMVTLLQKHRAQVCFSPPKIFPENQNSLHCTRHWPLFRFAEVLAPYDGRLVPVSTLAVLQAVSGISGLLGSCASCIFTTATLQNAPMPVEFLHYGDTAWFYSQLCRIRTVYHGRRCSTFHVHDFSKRQIRHTDLDPLIDRLSADYQQLQPASPLPALLNAFQHARALTDFFREPHPFRFWWLNPWAWFWRLRREYLRTKLLWYANQHSLFS